MSTCTSCNWSVHDVSVHGEFCANDHPLDIVGRYRDGRCRACHRAVVKRYYWAHRDKIRAYWRRWYANKMRGRRAFVGSVDSGPAPLLEHAGLVLLADQDGPLISIGGER